MKVEVEVVKPAPANVTITMTKEEASELRELCGAVGVWGEKLQFSLQKLVCYEDGYRYKRVTDRVWAALKKAGV